MTVTVAVVLAAPEVAVIVAEPFAIAVTRPADETVALVVSEDAHVTVALTLVLSFASFTVAVIVTVSANEAKVCDVSDNVMELIT